MTAETRDMGEVEGAIKAALFRDIALHDLVNGQIFVGLEKEDLPSKLTGDNMAIISVTYSDDISSPFPGSATSHMGEIAATVQIDMASRKNKNLVRRCIQNVLRVLYNNINITIGPKVFSIVVDTRIPSRVFFDPGINAFHGVIRLPICYENKFE